MPTTTNPGRKLPMASAALLVLGTALLPAGACNRSHPAQRGSYEYWQARLQDPVTVGEALQALGHLHDPRAVTTLRTYLGQPGPHQADAALGLGYSGDTNQMPLLRAHIDAGAMDEDRVRLNQALVTAMRTLDAQAALPGFVALLSSPKADVRADAVTAIAATGNPNAGSALMHVFLRDPQVDVSRLAGQALADVHAVGAIPELTRALYRDAMYDIARLALVQMGSHSAPLLVQTMARRNAAVETLRSADKRPLPDGTIEARAGATLGSIRAPVGEALVLATLRRLYAGYASDPAAAEPALVSAIIELAYAAGNYGGPKAAEALIPMLQAPQETLRTTAAEALTNAGPGPKEIDALVATATKGSADAAAGILEALSRLGSSDDLERVRAVAKGGTPEISPAALAGLLEDVGERLHAQSACRDNVTCWREKTHDPSDRERERAAFELGWRHAAGAADDLLRLAEDVSADVRFAAVLSLHRMPKARLPLSMLQKIYEAQGSKLQYAAANQELKCLIARQKDL